MAVNPNNLLGQSNPNGTVGVSLGIDPAGANEAFSAGATSGFYVTPTSPAGMSVQVGGAVGVIDSALVRSASGITFPVGNVTGTPITLTVPAAPSTNSRIDSVVLYVDTSVTATATDGANAVGMEIVSGTSASSPVPPTEQQIRSAIQDGASIAYTVLANITVSSSTSTITASNISQANRAQLAADKIDFATICATISSTVTCTKQSYTKVNLNNAAGQNGNLTLSNGGVLIGEGISRVQISSAAYFTSGDSSMSQTYSIYIYKNNTSTTVLRGVKRTNSIVYDQIQAPAHVCEVTQGDILYMYIRNQSGADAALSADPVYSFMNVWAIG